MNKVDMDIIDDYKNHLIKSNINTAKIKAKINTIENLKSYEHCAKCSLKKLEKLSIEYKLYDSNYDEFRIAMGKFALGINKLDKFSISIKDKQEFIDTFLNINDIFEDLQQQNIMKDVYVWKF